MGNFSMVELIVMLLIEAVEGSTKSSCSSPQKFAQFINKPRHFCRHLLEREVHDRHGVWFVFGEN